MTRAGLRILSGGQTGVDRAALDAARSRGLPSGGWVPAGRWAEDGPIPEAYGGLRETSSPDPAERTRRNVEDAEAVLLLVRGAAGGGTRLALEAARELGRPHLVLDLGEPGDGSGGIQGPRAGDPDGGGSAPSPPSLPPEAVLAAWLGELGLPLRLNVAGPRESEAPGIHAQALRVLEAGLRPSAGAP